MLCQKFTDLTPLEQSTFIGSLAHACMNDDRLFELGERLIEQGKKKGLFDKVTINPRSTENINLN